MSEDLRSLRQQLKDEYDDAYKRLTDPEEQRKERLKRHRSHFTSDIIEDAGL